jgi:hypothetical protein
MQRYHSAALAQVNNNGSPGISKTEVAVVVGATVLGAVGGYLTERADARWSPLAAAADTPAEAAVAGALVGGVGAALMVVYIRYAIGGLFDEMARRMEE